MNTIVYVLPDLDKIRQDDKIKWCIDYLLIANRNANVETKHEFFDDKGKAVIRYNELLKKSLVKNF